MTDSMITMLYPRKSNRVRIYTGSQYTFTYQEIDPWTRLNLTSISGLCMSVGLTENDIDNIGRGTYTCEAVNNGTLYGGHQLTHIGVYSSSGRHQLEYEYQVPRHVLFHCRSANTDWDELH